MTYRIGVLGVGIIGEPVVRGLIRAHGDDIEIRLSPRSAERSARLAYEFRQVRVSASNQEVLDGSDWIVVALLGPAAEGIVRCLDFRPDHRVVSLIGSADLASLRDWTGRSAITRMIPLPYVAHGLGPVATYPLNAEVERVFGGLGTLVAAEDEADLDTIATITSTQSAFFAVVGEVVRWGSRQGLAPGTAQDFALQFYAALLVRAARLGPAELMEHWREMTPGGFNHTAMTSLIGMDAIQAWPVAMDAVKARLDTPE
ncbi:MAG: NAD(P)-binding domain-containing protein [Propionibacteriaceae bacterium]|nr:NAD(P)-binding domain-containing protein [Propionibacteriaceae bacterium]